MDAREEERIVSFDKYLNRRMITVFRIKNIREIANDGVRLLLN